MSNLENTHGMSFIFVLLSQDSMSHVDLKKRVCRHVEFKGKGPHVIEEPGV